jgi:PPOX class probable F420-dependent enzyme
MPARPAALPDPGVERRLHHEPVVWVTTVRPDGRPHVAPTWFWWDGSAFLVFSKPHAVKVANLAQQPTVMLALGDPATADFDVLLVEGVASLLPDPTARVLPSAHLAKYRTWLQAIGLGRDEYAATYSQPVRIVPTRFLGWHGRTPRGTVATGASATGVSAWPASGSSEAFGGDRQPRFADAARRRPYGRRRMRASSSVHAGSRPAADGRAARSREAMANSHRPRT